MTFILALANEEREREEAGKANQELAQQRQSLLSRHHQLRKELEQIEGDLMRDAKLLDTKERNHRVHLEQQTGQLQAFERHLGLRMVSMPGNGLQFTFTLIDPKAPQRPFTLELNAAGAKVSVKKCEPMLKDLESLMGNLLEAEGGDIWAFIKAVRAAFVRSCQ